MAGWFKAPLVTQHLQLRPTQPGDEEWIIKLFTDPEVRKYVGGAISEAKAREIVHLSETWWAHFAILDREHGQAIGSVKFETSTAFGTSIFTATSVLGAWSRYRGDQQRFFGTLARLMRMK